MYLHYFNYMRRKDERKVEAISKATQKIVCERGLDHASIGDIAKEANVSPATIYLYFKNKPDLLSKVFFAEKQAIVDTVTSALSPASSFRENFALAHKAAFDYMWKNPISLRFTEVLRTTPYNLPQELSEQYGEFWEFWESGIEQGIVEDIAPDTIMMMVLAPLAHAVLQFHSLYCSCQMEDEAQQLAAKYADRVEKMQQELFYLTWKALEKSAS